MITISFGLLNQLELIGPESFYKILINIYSSGKGKFSCDVKLKIQS